MQVFFEQREEIGPGIWQYAFRPERPCDFVPGQYVHLYLIGIPRDTRGASRTFSLTSLPQDASLNFVTKHFELQTAYKLMLEQFEPGDAARIDDAMGDLILPKLKETPLVFIAGGIGIASYVSMFKELLSRKEERPIFLFYYVRSRREMIFRQLIDSYPLSGKEIAIAPNRIRAEDILSTVPPSSLFYISGSQRFTEEILGELEAMNVPRSHIVFDYYDGYIET
jgi:ferredoxin-NADP reductase